MREVHDRLHVASDRECVHDREGWSIVHACKRPCHERAVGYSGDLGEDHPHYLVLEDGPNLYMNLIDPVRPLFEPDSFRAFLDFAARRYDGGDELLIHCNAGRSRSPSLALLLLSKHLDELPEGSYGAAREAYERRDPGYVPSPGIRTFLSRNWKEL